MNTLNLKAMAAICGALLHPVTLAQGFTQQPAPVVRARRVQIAPADVRLYAAEIEKMKTSLSSARDAADEMYVDLVNSNPAELRQVVEPQSKKIFSTFEQSIRGAEGMIKLLLEDSDGVPDFMVTGLRSYLRDVMETRASVVRLNQFLEQLEPVATVFDGRADVDVLKEMATATTEKLGSMRFH